MVLYEMACGCKFESCGAATYSSDHVDASCGCKFHSCGCLTEANSKSEVGVDVPTAETEDTAATDASEHNKPATSGLLKRDPKPRFFCEPDDVSSEGDELCSCENDTWTDPVSHLFSSSSEERDFRPSKRRRLSDISQRLRDSIYDEPCSLEMGSLVGGYPRYGTRKYCADEADVKWNPVKGSFTSEFVPEALAPEVTDLLSFHAQRLDRQIVNQQRATQIRREDYTNRHLSSRNIRRHGGQPYQGDTNGLHHRGRQPQGNGRRTRNTRPRNSSRISWPQGSMRTQPESGPTANTDRQPQLQVGPQPSNETGDAANSSTGQPAEQMPNNGHQDSSKDQGTGPSPSNQ